MPYFVCRTLLEQQLEEAPPHISPYLPVSPYISLVALVRAHGRPGLHTRTRSPTRSLTLGLTLSLTLSLILSLTLSLTSAGRGRRAHAGGAVLVGAVLVGAVLAGAVLVHGQAGRGSGHGRRPGHTQWGRASRRARVAGSG